MKWLFFAKDKLSMTIIIVCDVNVVENELKNGLNCAKSLTQIGNTYLVNGNFNVFAEQTKILVHFCLFHLWFCFYLNLCAKLSNVLSNNKYM